MKTTLDNLNLYLSTRFNSDSWESGVSKGIAITGEWRSYGDGYIVSSNGNARQELVAGNYLYINKRPSIVLAIVNNNKVKIERVFEMTIPQSVYRLSEQQFKDNSIIDNKHLQALTTAEIRVTSGKYWTLPQLWSTNIYYGIYEFAFWLYTTNGTNESIQDINNGIVRKKIDVLEWEYDKDMQNSIIPGSQEAQDFLKEYENSIGTGGGVYDL